MKDSKFVIGIDLGTTNSAVSYIDAKEDEVLKNTVFQIPQVVEAGVVEERPVLPSFAYIPGEHELPKGSIELPWKKSIDYCVGEFAREQGSKVPQRMISSAKSWLCHNGVDRNAGILPWNSPDELEKVSPVEVSTRYLAHMKEAWNENISEGDEALNFENQDIILTVPASFDAVARELTVKAASEAGFEVTLLEEPQAALYAWLEGVGEKWRKILKVGDLIFVCDIGGGTTDFSLITVQEEKGDLVLERIAVGDHILLGGDNMDLTLALTISGRLKNEGTKLDSWQLQALCQSCRVAKENMLGDPGMKKHQIVIPGRGSKLIGGAVKLELTRNELESVIIDGFFPMVEADAYPERTIRHGLMELGLPYETEAAITKHIAKFLNAHQKSIEKHYSDDDKKGELILPTCVLLNGGVFKSPILSKRIVDVINGWVPSESEREEVKILEGSDLDLAVAKGAAYYAMVKRGKGIRIRGGTARSYYIGVESSMPAVPGMKPPLKGLCIAPQAMEEGTEAELTGQDFGLLIGEQVEFRFLESSTRRDDRVGTIVEDWEEGELNELSPLRTELVASGRTGQVVPVTLRSHVTEIGTLELWCDEKNGDEKWKLEFDIREK